MSKSVLISIQPKWCELIASGKKIIEVRKSAPKLKTPFKCYIYETKGKKVECGFHFEETGRTLRDKYVFGMHEARIVKHYCNEGKGKVIGDFVCDKVLYFPYMTNPDNEHEKVHWISQKRVEETCLTYEEIKTYGKGKTLYGWHISDLKIYDKPKELSEFWGQTKCSIAHTRECWVCFAPCKEIDGKIYQPMKRPVQSWGYCKELEK